MATSNNAPTASWRGLLLHGIDHCAAFGHPRPVPGWTERMRWLVEHGDTEDLLAVATEIERRLQGDKFRDWINSTIGKLPRINSELPRAINQLNVPVATTNYDDFAAEVTLSDAVPWIDRPDIDEWLKRKDRRHLHLHGIWHRPDSLVLGHSSYGRLTADDRTQFVQRVLGTRRLLLIGYGAGLNDPNLGPLLGWLRDELSGGNRNDYLLCLDADSHNDGPFVRVPIGHTYGDLIQFLCTLAPLSARHQRFIDAALAYEAVTQTIGDHMLVGQANKLVEDLGREIAAQASLELFDALEDWAGGFGLSIGLVKAITFGRSRDGVQRILEIASRFPAGRQYLNPKHHITKYSIS